MNPSQASRSISVATVLGPDLLLLAGMTATEHLSAPFEYELSLLSEKIDVRADDLLGTTATVALRLPSGERRFFNGYINRFSQVGFTGTYSLYRATLVPWIWFLSRTADCRIFQDQTVPDIVKAVFRDHGFTDFDERLSASYRQWTYCVQYRETDLSFVNRLLEHEGIYYFHEHRDGKHSLVLADSRSAHAPVAGYEQVVYFPPGETPLHDFERIDDWQVAAQVRPGAFAHTAFDFTAPRKRLLARRSAPRGHPLAGLEVFDFQGDYTEPAAGDEYARIRLEECQADHEVARASGNARGLNCGALFTLKEHPRADQNREYLIIEASYRLQSDDFGSADPAPTGPVFQCSLSAMDAQVPYRPPRVTPKPIVQGPQTAIVVGKAGEEIWTDQYGRVKVHFHWDREAQGDESSSCWVRVAQVAAGKAWGGMMIPRIGTEVIVDFLEGDPDQPIIIGRVYNGDQMPPWDLPANMTQSGILTRSTKGGGAANANAIRFEDKIGAEQLWTHAEKNQDSEVENDETHWVGHDRTKTIDHDETTLVKHDRTETVGNDEKISIGRDRSLLVERDKTETVIRDKAITVTGRHAETIARTMEINVGASLAETVAVNYSETVGAAMELTVGGALAIGVGAVMTEAVGGAKALTIGGSFNESTGGGKTVSVGTSYSVSVDQAMTLKVGKDVSETIAGKQVQTVAKEYLLQAKKIQLKADDELSIKVGSAEIVVKKNGDITLNGNKITIKGSGDVVIKGSKIAEN